MHVKKRNIQHKLLKILESFPAALIIGARQTGKTFLAKQQNVLHKENEAWSYYDLEDREHYELISSDPKFFFQRHDNKVIIDEAQKYPELFETLRGVIDDDREKNGRFILTGSSSPALLKNASESLAGRIGIIELGTFKLNEFDEEPLTPLFDLFDGKKIDDILSNTPPVATPDLNRLFNFWFHGGYPKAIIDFDEVNYELWMNNYIDTYINRDLKALFPKMNSIRYQKFISMLSNSTATIIKKSDFARSIDVSEPTINDYIKIADGTFFWRTLTSFEHNVQKEITKMPKGHVRDLGIVHNLLKIKNFEALEMHPIIGRSFESFVMEEIIKGIEAKSFFKSSFHYYRTRGGAEIDLIIHNKNGIFPIEIKFGIETPAKMLKSLKNFVIEHNLPFGILVNNAENIEFRSKEILQIPARFW